MQWDMKLANYNLNILLTFLTFIIFLTAILLVTYGYHGYGGTESYLPINHLISELGNKNKSQLFFVFNIGIFLVGIILLVTIFISQLNSFLGKFCLLLSSIGLLGVGAFPEHFSISIHIFSATIFFAFSGIGVGVIAYQLFSFKNKSLISIFGLITFIVFLLIVILPKTLLIEFISQKENFKRPDFWLLAFIEWLYVCFYIIWFALLQIKQNLK